MCPKKLCVALFLSICSLTAAYAGERHNLSEEDTVNVDRAAERPAETGLSRMIKNRPVDASGFRLALLGDAVLLRWKFENVAQLGSATLEESSDGQPFTAMTVLSKDAIAYTDANLRPDRRYRIRMVANDGTVVTTPVLNTEGHLSAQ